MIRDWLFSDMSWLFFATWSVIVATVAYAAFRGDAKAMSRSESARSVPPADSIAR